MSTQDRVERNIALTFDFLRYLIDHPEMIDRIPDGTELEFIGPDIVTTEPQERLENKGRRTVITARRIYDLLSEE